MNKLRRKVGFVFDSVFPLKHHKPVLFQPDFAIKISMFIIFIIVKVSNETITIVNDNLNTSKIMHWFCYEFNYGIVYQYKVYVLILMNNWMIYK